MLVKVCTDIRNLALEIFQRRYVIFELAKRDFQAANKSTYLGSFWGYLQPIAFIIILWVVFTYGLRANPSGEVPFFVYLAWGMLPWLFFSSTLEALTHVIRQHSFLLKKERFALHILPISKLLSALLPHLTMIILLFVLSAFYGVYPSLYAVQLLYYDAGMFLLLLGLGWITSSTSIFVRDVGNLVALFLQFGFWLTPVFWDLNMVPARYQWIIKANPVQYLVAGYRDCIIYRVPFWSKPWETVYFWCFTLTVLAFGATLFKRLRPHFAEVI